MYNLSQNYWITKKHTEYFSKNLSKHNRESDYPVEQHCWGHVKVKDEILKRYEEN